jgi:hypothetical protein
MCTWVKATNQCSSVLLSLYQRKNWLIMFGYKEPNPELPVLSKYFRKPACPLKEFKSSKLGQ